MLMDQWAAAHPGVEILAQIGEGTYEPRNMKSVRTLTRTEFDQQVRSSDLIVAHAGVGSVVTALEVQKPIVLLPRSAAAKEHTTDHQLHTAKWLTGRPGVFVALTDAELGPKIDEARAAGGHEALPPYGAGSLCVAYP